MTTVVAAVAHVGAIAREQDAAVAALPVATRDAEADRADRLLLGPAARARDAGDPDADVRAEALQRAVGERRRDLQRDRAVRVDQLRGHARERRLGLVGVDDHAAEHVRRRAPRSVSRAAISPPVQDSATATVRPASSPITWSSTVEPSSENSVSRVALADRRLERVVDLGGGRLEDGRDLDLAAPQAGRDLERSIGTPSARSRAASRAISDSGIPNSRSIRCS